MNKAQNTPIHIMHLQFVSCSKANNLLYLFRNRVIVDSGTFVYFLLGPLQKDE